MLELTVALFFKIKYLIALWVIHTHLYKMERLKICHQKYCIISNRYTLPTKHTTRKSGA